MKKRRRKGNLITTIENESTQSISFTTLQPSHSGSRENTDSISISIEKFYIFIYSLTPSFLQNIACMCLLKGKSVSFIPYVLNIFVSFGLQLYFPRRHFKSNSNSFTLFSPQPNYSKLNKIFRKNRVKESSFFFVYTACINTVANTVWLFFLDVQTYLNILLYA